METEPFLPAAGSPSPDGAPPAAGRARRRLLPSLPAAQWRVLGLVSAASLFGQYDRAIFALALPQIQAGLGIAESQVGALGGVVRLGALPALALALAADRVGRRRALLATILAYTALTGATAFAPGVATFVALQTLATTFSHAEVLIGVVVVAEEFDDAHRGFGIGALFALQAVGTGLAAAALPFVDATPLGWRALYLVGLGPLLLLAWWRRGLPETRRFSVYEAAFRGDGERRRIPFLAPLRALAREYPGRVAAMAATVACSAAGGAAADFLGAKYLQQAHGWRPSDVTTLYLAGGLVGILSSVVAGRASDRAGRRRLAVGFGGASALLALAYYNSAGPLLAPSWIGLIFFVLGWEALLAAYAAELFPTSHRATAAALRLGVGTVFGALGLAAESWLYGVVGSHWRAVSLLLLLFALAPCVIALTFPETARRRLEEISPERAHPEGP